jgi:hypothetical protein
MSAIRLPATLVLGSVPVLIAALVGPGVRHPDSDPTAGRDAPVPAGGPVAAREILARDPALVAEPTLTAAAAATPCPAASSGVHHYAPGAGKTVALTFDDGPGATTAAILSILQRYGVPATFFNLGVNASVRPALVRSEVVAGHVVGNYTWDHPRMSGIVPFGHECRQSVRTGLCRACNHDVDVGRARAWYEVLDSADHIVVAVAGRGSSDARDV